MGEEETTGRYYVRRREFLNKDPEWHAFIIGVVEDTREIPNDDPERSWTNGTITLDLADCDDRVSFYFDMRNKSARTNSLQKINLLAEIVSAVRDAIESEVESRNARPVKPEAVETEENSQAQGAVA